MANPGTEPKQYTQVTELSLLFLKKVINNGNIYKKFVYICISIIKECIKEGGIGNDHKGVFIHG